MDAVERLEAIEEIRQLKGRYFFHLDTKDWDGWAKVFADDVVMDVSSQFPDAPDKEAFIYRGVGAVLANVPPALTHITTAHHGHTPLITIAGEDAASGIWAMEDNLILPDGSRMLGYGHYHEGYRKIDGVWKIAQTRLVRIKVIMLPA